MQSHANVVWQGSLKHGQGAITTESGALDKAVYSFGTRFVGEKGTNPEELIAAAHAACFTMAIAAKLSEEDWQILSISTQATVTLDKNVSDWTISSSHLEVEADIPDMKADRFQEIANEVKDACPVSKVLKAKITMGARLKFGSVPLSA